MKLVDLDFWLVNLSLLIDFPEKVHFPNNCFHVHCGHHIKRGDSWKKTSGDYEIKHI